MGESSLEDGGIVRIKRLKLGRVCLLRIQQGLVERHHAVGFTCPCNNSNSNSSSTSTKNGGDGRSRYGDCLLVSQRGQVGSSSLREETGRLLVSPFFCDWEETLSES